MKNRVFRLSIILGILFLLVGIIALFLTDSTIAGLFIFLSLICNCTWAVILQNRKHAEKTAKEVLEAEKAKFKQKKKKKR